jgi:hypothetical protein
LKPQTTRFLAGEGEDDVAVVVLFVATGILPVSR